ncbi:MAG TPA: C4-type zinc ribbon domain-containing protein [Pyrinomonadaceae bacterium]|nr:C4-type zinc ribbon domain-containing protein [Pyrinomonadaceae bacterium]
MKAELEQLIALQQTDTEIRKLQAELNAIPQRRAEIEKEFDQRASEFKQVESRRDESRARRSQLDKDLAETRTRAEKAERDLMSSTNSKAYEAAIREMDAAKKQISQLETQILEQMETLEQADKEIGEREPEIAKLRVEQEEKLRDFEGQTRGAGERLEQLRAERERLFATLPKSVAAMYNRISMRIRDGVAVAEARNGSCSSCFIALRPQMMAEVRRGDEIVVCDNCNRILYYADAQAQKAS